MLHASFQTLLLGRYDHCCPNNDQLCTAVRSANLASVPMLINEHAVVDSAMDCLVCNTEHMNFGFYSWSDLLNVIITDRWKIMWCLLPGNVSGQNCPYQWHIGLRENQVLSTSPRGPNFEPPCSLIPFNIEL